MFPVYTGMNLKAAYRIRHQLHNEVDLPIDVIEEFGVTPYEDDRQRFLDDMGSLIEYLKRKKI